MQCQELSAGLNVPGKEDIEVCGYVGIMFFQLSPPPHCFSLFFFVISLDGDIINLQFPDKLMKCYTILEWKL